MAMKEVFSPNLIRLISSSALNDGTVSLGAVHLFGGIFSLLISGSSAHYSPSFLSNLGLVGIPPSDLHL